MLSAYHIQIPDRFTVRHRHIVVAFLKDDLRGREAWQLAIEAFDILGQATLHTPEHTKSFQTLYMEMVDEKYAQPYLQELLALKSVLLESPELWARYARQISLELKQRDWLPLVGGRTLLAYFLYWWGSFARGYAFEVEVFRNLEENGVVFEAHDLTSPVERFSPYDLVVNELTGDIKTSLYFVQLARHFSVDFFIVRLHIKRKTMTIAVLLRPEAWESLNGDTVAGTWDNFTHKWPHPVRIRQSGYDVVAIEYEEWKRRVLHWQGDQA